VHDTLPDHRLSPARIAAAAQRINPVFLNTPQFVCEPLSQQLGCELVLKVESVNPIRCFKGRGADWFVQSLLERGEAGPLACASAGNFGQALAYAGRQHRLPVTVFASRHANTLKLERMKALGADVRLEGDDFDAAKLAARAWAALHGPRFVEDGRDAAISEGAGSIAVELLAGGLALDQVLVPLGNGALLNGMARWIKAHAPGTRVVGVCSEGAPAMARAFAGAGDAADAPARTVADGIAVRVPVPEALADMHGLVDEVLTVADAHMLEAMRLLHRHAGLVAEPAGAAGLAPLLSTPARFAGQRIATVLCGSNLTPAQMREWL
jgi:threonine dehydratase